MTIRRRKPADLEIAANADQKPAKPLASFDSGMAQAEMLPQSSVEQQIVKVLEAITALAARIDELQSNVNGGGGKEWYTTVEFAALKGVEKSNYTCREWCRWRRINAVKAQAGRGVDGEWRIAHVEYLRYLNEGLLPPPRHNRWAKS